MAPVLAAGHVVLIFILFFIVFDTLFHSTVSGVIQMSYCDCYLFT